MLSDDIIFRVVNMNIMSEHISIGLTYILPMLFMKLILLHNTYVKDDNNDGCSKRIELEFHIEICAYIYI